ncbi:hypothetical protein EDB85DRAFT_1868212, partial [Lactarius pseudohatsudake]
AEFITRYRAIVFKPFKGEVVRRRLYHCFLSSLLIVCLGRWAEVGPLNCFVSQQVRYVPCNF